MKKLLLLLLLLPFISKAQYQNVGTTTLQRAPTPKGYFFRDNTSKGFVYWYTQGQIDSIAINRIPVGQRNQILKTASDNSTTIVASDALTYGQFIYTDAQKAKAFAAGSATQLQIFNSFNRYSNGGSPTDPSGQDQNNTIPGQPLQTNSWAYDTTAKIVTSTFNSGGAIGLVSRDKFDSYIHSATIGGTTTSDNDRIGIVIAFMEDSTDMVPNNAYGLNPADFAWPIDVTHAFIPNQHTLTLYINRDNNSLSYFVAYDFKKLTQATIINGSALSGLYNTTNTWNGVSLDVKVVRTSDTVRITRSQYSDAPGGKGALAFPLTFTLNDNPVLAKFKGKHAYGYSAQSQDNAYFGNIFFSGSTNLVYDLRNGDTYRFTSSGYTLDVTKNLYTDLGYRIYWRDTLQGTFGYLRGVNQYDVIKGEKPLIASATLDFPSTTAQTSSVLTVSMPGAILGDIVTMGVPNAAITTNGLYSAYVSASNTVTVKFNNYGSSSSNPASGIFNLKILK